MLVCVGRLPQAPFVVQCDAMELSTVTESSYSSPSKQYGRGTRSLSSVVKIKIPESWRHGSIRMRSRSRMVH